MIDEADAFHPGLGRIVGVVRHEHGDEALCLPQLEVMRRRLVNQELVLIVTGLRLDAFEAIVRVREMNQQAAVLWQLSHADPVVAGVVPVVPLSQDLTRVTQVGDREVLLHSRLHDVEDHEHLGILDVRNNAVPLESPPVVDHPGPAVVDVG